MSDMSGMSQYVVKNSSIVLSGANYNEMDALVFAQLSYLKFENIVELKNKKSVTMDEFVDAMLDSGKVTGDNRILLENIKNSGRYKNCTISNMEAENDTSQWAAITVNMNDSENTAVIAMRGTDGTTLGWGENFELVYSSKGTKVQKLSKEYLERIEAENIYMTGHSKGGNDVVSAYCMAEEEERNKVKRIDNFDGPGVCTEFEIHYKNGYEELDDKLHNYYPENSVVGLLLNDNPGEVHYVEAEIRENYKDKGIFGEHDAHSWQIDENGNILISSEGQSEFSEYLDNVLDGSLAQLNQYERYCVIQFLKKIGVPGVISDEKDTPYADNDEIAEEIIDYIYKYGKIPIGTKESQKDFLEKILTVCEIVKLWSSTMPHKKLIIVKTVAAILTVAVWEGARVLLKKGMDLISEKLEEVQEWFVNSIEKVEKIIVFVLKDFTEKVKEFKERVKEKIEESWNSAKNYVQKKLEAITRKKIDYRKNADFSVNSDVLVVYGDDFSKYSTRLKNYCERVQSIQRNLAFSTTLISFYKFRNVKNDLRQEQKACKNLDKAIEKIAKTYRNTENRIKNNARV